jgi:hypothetical protein
LGGPPDSHINPGNERAQERIRHQHAKEGFTIAATLTDVKPRKSIVPP